MPKVTPIGKISFIKALREASTEMMSLAEAKRIADYLVDHRGFEISERLTIDRANRFFIYTTGGDGNLFGTTPDLHTARRYANGGYRVLDTAQGALVPAYDR